MAASETFTTAGTIAVNDLTVFTIGHSTHPVERVLELLAQHGITAVGDVRSNPHSRFSPQFNQSPMRRSLEAAGINYVFLGGELGARPNDTDAYVDGRASYARMAARPEFEAGLQRVVNGAGKYRLALLCAEKDPTHCHRMILVCRHLRPLVARIDHILADGTLETNSQAERRLCQALGLSATLFEDEATIVEQAYDLQGSKIAWAPQEERNTDV